MQDFVSLHDFGQFKRRHLAELGQFRESLLSGVSTLQQDRKLRLIPLEFGIAAHHARRQARHGLGELRQPRRGDIAEGHAEGHGACADAIQRAAHRIGGLPHRPLRMGQTLV